MVASVSSLDLIARAPVRRDYAAPINKAPRIFRFEELYYLGAADRAAARSEFCLPHFVGLADPARGVARVVVELLFFRGHAILFL